MPPDTWQRSSPRQVRGFLVPYLNSQLVFQSVIFDGIITSQQSWIAAAMADFNMISIHLLLV